MAALFSFGCSAWCTTPPLDGSWSATGSSPCRPTAADLAVLLLVPLQDPSTGVIEDAKGAAEVVFGEVDHANRLLLTPASADLGGLVLADGVDTDDHVPPASGGNSSPAKSFPLKPPTSHGLRNSSARSISNSSSMERSTALTLLLCAQ